MKLAYSVLLCFCACGGPKLGPPPTTVERLNAESVRRLERGDDTGAEETIRTALREAELVDDLVGQAEAWNNLGALSMARGHYRDAWAAHANALALYQSSNIRSTGEVRTRANLGAALLASARVAEAKAQFVEAIALADRLNAPNAAGLARAGLASVALSEGNPARARELARAAEDPVHETAYAGACAIEGAADEALGDLASARAAYERALSVDRRRAVPRAVAEDLRGLARVAERAGDSREATLLWTRSARIARRLGERGSAEHDLERALKLSAASDADESRAALEEELRALRQTGP